MRSWHSLPTGRGPGVRPAAAFDRLLGDRFGHPACGLGQRLHLGAHRGLHGLSDHRRGCGAASRRSNRRRGRADRGSAVVGLPREPQPGRVRSRVRLACSPRRCAVTSSSRRYGGTTDRVTRVDPAGPTRSASRRPTRSASTRGCGGSPSSSRASRTRPRCAEMGELMYASHASYSACGLGSDGTDLLVELVRQAGPAAGLFGAKITGGGSGGTVAILGRPTRGRPSPRSPARYHEQTGRRAVRLRRLVAGRLRIRRAT